MQSFAQTEVSYEANVRTGDGEQPYNAEINSRQTPDT